MTKQSLEILLEHVATWPEEAQEELVQSMVDIEKKHLGIYSMMKNEQRCGAGFGRCERANSRVRMRSQERLLATAHEGTLLRDRTS